MSKERETSGKEHQLKDARILMVSRFKSGTVGGVPSTTHSLETYWSNIVQNVSTLRIDNQNLIDISDDWDLIIFHHPSAFWINKFLELPDNLKSRSSVIWHQAVDEEILEIFRKLGVGNFSPAAIKPIEEETHKRRLIANYPGVFNYAISETVRSSLIKSGILIEEKISVVRVPPALPTEPIELKKFNERGSGKFIVLVVSRISPEKGIENVLEIYKNIFDFTQRFPNKCSKPISFLVVGDATNKPYNNLVMDSVRTLSTSSMCSIEFLGNKSREDLGKLYGDAHIFLMPSLFDSWGLVTTEALHYGLPIIAFEAPGTKEIFSKSKNEIGSLVGNIQEGVRSIINIMTNRGSWLRFSSGALNESKNYQPREISLNLLQKLWYDRYK